MCLWLFVLLLLVGCVFGQNPNATVALDGTGNFRSIGEAVGSIPNNSDHLFFLYVKEGWYNESVYVGTEKRNVILYGDGKGKTVIASSRSNQSGYRIQDSAALNVHSENFLAKDLSIVNTAGSEGGQAVALRIEANHIACFRCSIEGHQDTLFTPDGSNQFFRDCDIKGTTDFIFGDAAVVVQNSYIHVRLPRDGQQNMITADGRMDNNSDTAIVIHNCSIIPTPELKNKPNVKTYLGRPWKKYSRTIIMESYLDGFIDGEGWQKFDDSTNVSTLYYAEYGNFGDGSSTGGRVKWPGYHILTNPKDVEGFTVENFIKGHEWLPKLQVPYTPGLVG